MKIYILNLLFSFFFFSILGWILEVSYRSVRDKRFINPGLLKGPYLIIYGTGALILMGVVSLFQGSHVLTRVLVYFLATTGLELISGLIARFFFHAHLWDYSDQRFNFRGHICLKFSIYWILIAFAFEYFILPPYQCLLTHLSPLAKGGFSTITFLIMFVDFLAVSINSFLHMTPEEKVFSEAQFINSARPLLELPEIERLSQYKHHRGKTRLDHVKEVAYLSFLWGKRFSLDCDAIIRGALLHDLFYYDWLREGPRLHGFRHPGISLKNARRITPLSKKEEDIIKKHMWPLTIVPPRYMESLVVSLVDTFCSVRDYMSIKRYGKTEPVETTDTDSKTAVWKR